MDQRIIWVLREYRSGSTWFTMKLCKLLNKEFYFFDNKLKTNFQDREKFFVSRKQEKDDYMRILNTHHYFALKSFNNYNNPIVFNVTRKNRTEQFLSFYFAFKYSSNIPNKVAVNLSKDKLDLFPKYEKHVVPEIDALEFCKTVKSNSKLWYNNCNNFEHETIYYEDLLDGYNSKLLRTNLCMETEMDNDLPVKLPYNKQEVVLNYSKIENIILENTN